MRRSPHRLLALALAAVAGAVTVVSPTLAQKGDGKEPKRPKLPAQADTNDPNAYYEYAMGSRVPWDKTYDAIYWAYRLEPANYSTLLALRQAMWMKQPWEWRWEYLMGAEFVEKSREARQLDSLDRILNERDPFAHLTSSRCWVSEEMQEIKDPYELAYAYLDGHCHAKFAEQLGVALAAKPNDRRALRARVDRAKASFWLAHYGNAIAELKAAIATLRARDEQSKKVVRWYESKAQLEYMLGRAYMHEDDYNSAREAFGRALAEDLSFYQGHAALAQVALVQEDVDAAVTEFDQAVQLKENDGVLRYRYGNALLRARKAAEAEAQLRKAIELEPYWAAPHLGLAEALQMQGKGADALQEYDAFLARVPRKRLGALGNVKARRDQLATRLAGAK